MNIILPLQIWLSLHLIVRALVVQTARDKNPSLTDSSLLPSHSSLIHLLNHTSLAQGSRPAVFCDGDQYGRDLVIADCRDAITGIKRSRQQERYGERTADKATWDVGLPFRQIGSEDAAENVPLVTLVYRLTSKQYRDSAQCNWSLSLADHPLLLHRLMYPKLLSPS